jgi:hypothetical protein
MELKLSPWQLEDLYLDDIDLFGLFWWADEISEQNKKLKSK